MFNIIIVFQFFFSYWKKKNFCHCQLLQASHLWVNLNKLNKRLTSAKWINPNAQYRKSFNNCFKFSHSLNNSLDYYWLKTKRKTDGIAVHGCGCLHFSNGELIRNHVPLYIMQVWREVMWDGPLGILLSPLSSTSDNAEHQYRWRWPLVPYLHEQIRFRTYRRRSVIWVKKRTLLCPDVMIVKPLCV